MKTQNFFETPKNAIFLQIFIFQKKQNGTFLLNLKMALPYLSSVHKNHKTFCDDKNQKRDFLLNFKMIKNQTMSVSWIFGNFKLWSQKFSKKVPKSPILLSGLGPKMGKKRPKMRQKSPKNRQKSQKIAKKMVRYFCVLGH